MRAILATLALALAAGPALADPLPATVVRLIDGDTVLVAVPAWAGTPLATVKVRVAGIDTPESRKPPARCKAEIALGHAATAYAATLLRPGDAVALTYRGLDKFARVDGALALPDGRDLAAVMLASGHARPYDGRTKASWCRSAPLPPKRPAS